jgi:hypothetical protein
MTNRASLSTHKEQTILSVQAAMPRNLTFQLIDCALGRVFQSRGCAPRTPPHDSGRSILRFEMRGMSPVDLVVFVALIAFMVVVRYFGWISLSIVE